MAKFVCQVCGYVYEGDSAPEFCPVCKAPASKFSKQEETLTWAAEHVVGVAKGVSEDILADLPDGVTLTKPVSVQLVLTEKESTEDEQPENNSETN